MPSQIEREWLAMNNASLSLDQSHEILQAVTSLYYQTEADRAYARGQRHARAHRRQRPTGWPKFLQNAYAAGYCDACMWDGFDREQEKREAAAAPPEPTKEEVIRDSVVIFKELERQEERELARRKREQLARERACPKHVFTTDPRTIPEVYFKLRDGEFSGVYWTQAESVCLNCGQRMLRAHVPGGDLVHHDVDRAESLLSFDEGRIRAWAKRWDKVMPEDEWEFWKVVENLLETVAHIPANVAGNAELYVQAAKIANKRGRLPNLDYL